MPTKAQRIIVWDKSEGKCWYCGCDLPTKGWHVDHLLPIIRETVYVVDSNNRHAQGKVVATGKSLRPHLDTIENMVPSCAPCNLFKSVYDIEFFRQEIAAQRERVRKSSSGFRIAERFDIIEVKDNPVVFWFEKQKK